jgi:hypothetical protein
MKATSSDFASREPGQTIVAWTDRFFLPGQVGLTTGIIGGKMPIVKANLALGT